MAADFVADTKELEKLAADMAKAKRQLIGRLGERGYQLLRDEVPQDTGNMLRKGVTPAEVDYEKSEAVLNVSATRDSYGSQQARVIGADGKEKKTVSLKARPAYNYAEVVALGNRQARLSPKTAKAFLIPVPVAPAGESYLLAGGQVFVLRRSRKGQKANPYHERAGTRLEREAPAIADAELRKIFG